MIVLLLLLSSVLGNAPAQPREFVVQLADGADPIQFAEQVKGLTFLGPVGQLEGYYRFQVVSENSLRLRHALDTDARVLYAEQQVPRVFARRVSPIDPLYGKQWHLPLVEAFEAW